jgi:hypothetical protein
MSDEASLECRGQRPANSLSDKEKAARLELAAFFLLKTLARLLINDECHSEKDPPMLS